VTSNSQKPGDYSYGLLNSIEIPRVGPSLDLGGTDPWGMLKSAAMKQYQPDALANTGPYRGIVLRVEEVGATNIDDATTYIYTSEAPSPELVKIKVRVPELHSMLPPPDQWGDVDGDHHAIINLYPTYIAQSDLVVIPAVRDVVWVDYTNKNNFTDPIYIRPVTEKKYFMEQVVPLIASAVFAACAATTPGAASPDATGDTTRSTAGPGTQPYPQGARKEPSGETEIIVDTNLPPPDFRKPNLIKFLDALGLKVGGWVGRLKGNGKREVTILAPKTTDFSKPIELIYWLHGAKSWYSANTPKFILNDMKGMSSEGRNFAVILVQLPWPGPQAAAGKFSGEGGKSSSVFTGGSTGDFGVLHTECLGIINKWLSGGTTSTEVFITVGCHSKGGQALKAIAKSGQLSAVAPDKIICADSDYRAFGGNATEIIWDNYVSKAGKNVEFDLLCISPKRRPDSWPEKGQTVGSQKGDNGNQPRKAMQRLMKEKLSTEVDRAVVTAEFQNGGGTAYVTYAPLMLDHSTIAIRHGIKFKGAGPGKPPKENKENSEELPPPSTNNS